MSLGSGQFSSQNAVKPHLVQGSGGVAAEVADLRADIKRDFAPNIATAVEEWTNPAAVSTTAIRLATATATSARTLSGSALSGAIGGGAISPPRNITVTTAGTTASDAPASVTITGEDINGDTMSETITVSQTAATVLGSKAFAKVTEISEAAADGTGATLAYGIGGKIGLGKKMKTRVGSPMVLTEVIPAGTVLGAGSTTGTFVAPATGVPNGTYAPASAPDGSRDYCLVYEYDASLNT